jgi:hypothetical protein
MALYPVNQKIKNAKNSSPNAPTPKKNPPADKKPIGFPTHEGDLGILKVNNPNIPRMVKAPTATGDSIRNHVGKVGSAMKKMGMLT